MQQSELKAIVERLELDGVRPETLSELRRLHPSIRLTTCSADDVETHTPYREGTDFQIHLLTSSGHCLSLTSELENAVGLVLAEL